MMGQPENKPSDCKYCGTHIEPIENGMCFFCTGIYELGKEEAVCQERERLLKEFVRLFQITRRLPEFERQREIEKGLGSEKP